MFNMCHQIKRRCIYVLSALLCAGCAGGIAAFDTQLVANTNHKLLLSVGRVPGTAMPPEWASSGARLAFAVDVSFKQEYSQSKTGEERLLGPSQTRIIEPVTQPTFVSVSGEETVKVLVGAWSTISASERSGRAFLRFFLDFPEGAQRNDVILPSERVYFGSCCWVVGDELDRAKQVARITKEKINALECELAAMREASKEKNAFQQATSIRPMVLLTEEKDFLQTRLAKEQRSLPKDGVISAPNGVLLQKEGTMYVKRWGGLLGKREEYHIVGRFSFVEKSAN